MNNKGSGNIGNVVRTIFSIVITVLAVGFFGKYFFAMFLGVSDEKICQEAEIEIKTEVYESYGEIPVLSSEMLYSVKEGRAKDSIVVVKYQLKDKVFEGSFAVHIHSGINDTFFRSSTNEQAYDYDYSEVLDELITIFKIKDNGKVYASKKDNNVIEKNNEDSSGVSVEKTGQEEITQEELVQEELQQEREFIYSDYDFICFRIMSLKNYGNKKEYLQNLKDENKRSSLFRDDFLLYVLGEENTLVEYLGEVESPVPFTHDTAYWYKVQIEDMEHAVTQLKRFADDGREILLDNWQAGDDIYFYLAWSYSKNEQLEVDYYACNYSLLERGSEFENDESFFYEPTDEYVDESYEENITYADWSVPCTADAIETPYYKIVVPTSWIGICNYDFTGSGWGVIITIPKGYDGVYPATICTVDVVWGDEEPLTCYDDVEWIVDEEYGNGRIVIEYPGDKQCTDSTESLYDNVMSDIDVLKSGITVLD